MLFITFFPVVFPDYPEIQINYLATNLNNIFYQKPPVKLKIGARLLVEKSSIDMGKKPYFV